MSVIWIRSVTAMEGNIDGLHRLSDPIDPPKSPCSLGLGNSFSVEQSPVGSGIKRQPFRRLKLVGHLHNLDEGSVRPGKALSRLRTQHPVID